MSKDNKFQNLMGTRIEDKKVDLKLEKKDQDSKVLLEGAVFKFVRRDGYTDPKGDPAKLFTSSKSDTTIAIEPGVYRVIEKLHQLDICSKLWITAKLFA